jgi:hypothetical protein
MEVQGELTQGVIVLPEKRVKAVKREEIDRVAESTVKTILNGSAEA